MTSLNRNIPIPLYYQLKQLLLERIENGRYPIGGMLPPEMELIKEYQVSRATVRSAMQELEYDGYIQRIPGKGTFVLRVKLKRGLSQLTSFTEDMEEQGRTVTSQLLEFDKKIPPSKVSNLLGIKPDLPLIYLYRLRLADNIPIALNISYLNLPEGIHITETEIQEVVSLFSLLQDKGIRLIETDKTIEAIAANEEQAKFLNMNIGEPLLFLEGVVYTLNHFPIEYHQVISCGERHKYSLHLDR
ncbi:MAG: hypothetical protein B6I38_02415 [Anaerolineaceae bacterium 4572_5.1]|nr:MAG: hypothetical protein B6I38_02415 [Anaerolineaceae bacterium 4572_5.1]